MKSATENRLSGDAFWAAVGNLMITLVWGVAAAMGFLIIVAIWAHDARFMGTAAILIIPGALLGIGGAIVRDMYTHYELDGSYDLESRHAARAYAARCEKRRPLCLILAGLCLAVTLVGFTLGVWVDGRFGGSAVIFLLFAVAFTLNAFTMD